MSGPPADGPEPPGDAGGEPAVVVGASAEPVPEEAGGAAPTVHPGQRPRDSRAARELLHFLPDILRLLWDLVRDPRVTWWTKAATLGVAGYLVSPIDVLPDFIPGLGQLDDLYLAVWAIRRLIADAGYDIVREHWSGSDDGFALLLVVAGIDR